MRRAAVEATLRRRRRQVQDGVGDIEAMVTIYQRMGDRLAYLGGLPTAEVYAAAYKAIGTPVYSSAAAIPYVLAAA